MNKNSEQDFVIVCISCGRKIDGNRDDYIVIEKIDDCIPTLPTLDFCSWSCIYQFSKRLKGKPLDEGWRDAK
jgi:hypothetical protein